jgi:3-oxoacyl-[acyl-carrier-protein] synthase-1
MNEGKWQAIIFGGADSLISMDACLKLAEDSRLNTVGSTAGLVPGEAAAFVVLQTSDTAKTNTTPALAYLRGVGVAAEPNARDADIKATEGLSTAINQAIAQAGIAAADIQGIVHNLGAETVHAIEWYQTNKKIWPRRIDEQQRMAVQLGEIDQADTPDDPIPKIILPYMTMGEVGAAAMPMHLATALAWIEYDAHQARWGFPVRKHLLVCDTPDTPERGALIISTTAANAT